MLLSHLTTYEYRQPPPNEDDHAPRPTVPILAGLDLEGLLDLPGIDYSMHRLMAIMCAGSFTQVVHMEGSLQGDLSTT